MTEIIRGSTPTLKGKMPYSLSDVSAIYITFVQNRTVLFEKTKEDCFDVDDPNNQGLFGFRLTQAETLKLNPSYELSAQILVKTNDGIVRASKVYKDFDIHDRLKEGEI